MISGELDEFRYAFNQVGLDKTGFEDEDQWLTLRSLDGVNGRFYQLVLYNKLGEEKFWSFTDPEKISTLIRKFIEWSDRIDER